MSTSRCIASFVLLVGLVGCDNNSGPTVPSGMSVPAAGAAPSTTDSAATKGAVDRKSKVSDSTTATY